MILKEKQLKNLVLNLFNSGSLNKSSEVEYCQESLRNNMY